MPKRKDPLLEALERGESFTWTIPEGGDLASMRAAIKHGQTLTMSPVRNPSEVEVGNLVLVRWHGGLIYHLVGEIQDDRFLIINSVGKVNGWVDGTAILGRVTKTVDPEPRPGTQEMLRRLELIYRASIETHQPQAELSKKLLSVIDDLAWYANRLGPEQSDIMPQSNIWSFDQQLWRLMRQSSGQDGLEQSILDLIDKGKACVGAAAKIVALLNERTIKR